MRVKRVFHNRIKELRAEKKMTQAELAEGSGVGFSLLRQIETGRTISTKENLSSIAKALGCDVSEIFNEVFRVPQVISIANNKGGPGKTSITVNLAYALAEMGNKVLVIDSDMQMNTTASLNCDRNKDMSLFHAITEKTPIKELITPTAWENLDIVRSDYDLATIDLLMYNMMKRETIISGLMESVKEMGVYDYIIFDTNPTLGLLNLNCLAASEYILIPVELNAFGIEGLNTMADYINEKVRIINPDVELIGIVYNKVDKRKTIIDKANYIIKSEFGDYILKSEIPVDATVEKAQWKKMPVGVYDPASKAAQATANLANEIEKLIG